MSFMARLAPVVMWITLSALQSVFAQGGTVVTEWNLKSEESRAGVVTQLRGDSETERNAAWQSAADELWSPKGGGPDFQYELQAIRNVPG